jgi:hypothetical protein
MRFPTIAWLTGAEGPTLHSLCAAGALSSLLLTLGVIPAISAVTSWLVYLSLYKLGGAFLTFQWDILLLEAGFLAMFYAPVRAWFPWSPGWRFPPSCTVTWLLRILIFKLMFLSGVVKLTSGDPTWRNLTALTYHYETTCLPTWTGWYVHQLPAWFQKLSALGTFAVELVVPFFVFGPRQFRFAAAGAFAALNLFIAATGNYGFFNLLSVVLCVPLLDDRVFRIGVLRRLTDRLPELHGPFTARPLRAQLLAAVIGLVLVALNAMILTRALRFRIDWPVRMSRLYELQQPFQLANGYGLFARMTTERPEIIIEGSRDGEIWKTYEFRWKPGDLERRPAFVQPHMPRLDWRMWFAALGSYRNNQWFLDFCRKLLLGSREVLALLENDPFPGKPPRYLRATLYDYEFTTWKERGETGAWWRRRFLRPYTPVLTIDSNPPHPLRAVQLSSAQPQP